MSDIRRSRCGAAAWRAAVMQGVETETRNSTDLIFITRSHKFKTVPAVRQGANPT